MAVVADLTLFKCSWADDVVVEADLCRFMPTCGCWVGSFSGSNFAFASLVTTLLINSIFQI